jgi:hypothetical protein
MMYGNTFSVICFQDEMQQNRTGKKFIYNFRVNGNNYVTDKSGDIWYRD